MAIPREVRTLLDRQAGSEFGCVGDELVAQHGLAAVALGVDVAVHGGDESGDVGRAAGAAEPVDAVGEHVVAVRVIQSVRRGLQCIDVVVLLAVERDAGNGTVEQFLLQHVGVFALGLEVEHLLGEHAHGHGSAGLAVHRVVRQVVIVGERFAHMGGADRAGDIHTTGDDVLPETLGSVDQPLIAE